MQTIRVRPECQGPLLLRECSIGASSRAVCRLLHPDTKGNQTHFAKRRQLFYTRRGWFVFQRSLRCGRRPDRFPCLEYHDSGGESQGPKLKFLFQPVQLLPRQRATQQIAVKRDVSRAFCMPSHLQTICEQCGRMVDFG